MLSLVDDFQFVEYGIANRPPPNLGVPPTARPSPWSGCTAVSLAGLFDGAEVSGSSSLELEDAAHLIVRGGWPAATARASTDGQAARQYVDSVAEADISQVDGVEEPEPGASRASLRA